MPNRILREGILSSERVNSLDWNAEVFYRRLMSVVDDYGRFSANLSLLRASLYPLKLDTVREANLERLLAAVEQARLVRLYEVAGKRYLELLDFRQQVRAKSKYPEPPDIPPPAVGVADDKQAPGGCVADAQQVPANAHLVGVGVGGERGARAREAAPPPSPAALLSLALRRGGFPTASASDPRVIAAAESGLTPDEVESAAKEAVGSGKGFAYALSTAAGRRKDAANVQRLPPRRVNGADDDPFRGAV